MLTDTKTSFWLSDYLNRYSYWLRRC